MTSSLNQRTKVVLWLSGNMIYTFRKQTGSCRTTVFTNVLMLTPFSKIRKSSRTPLRTWLPHASYHQRLSILWSPHRALRGFMCYPRSTNRATLGVPLFLHAAAQPRTSQRTLMRWWLPSLNNFRLTSKIQTMLLASLTHSLSMNLISVLAFFSLWTSNRCILSSPTTADWPEDC